MYKKMLRSLVLEELSSQWFINEETPAPRPRINMIGGSAMAASAKFAYDNYGSSSVVKTVVHAVIAASAEYGLALATAGTSMAGASEVLETWVDTLFLAETSIMTAFSVINFGDEDPVGAGKKLIDSCQAAWSSLPQGLPVFYAAIKKIISTVVKGAAITAVYLSKIAKSIKKYIAAATTDIENYIKVLIPDTVIGTAAATAIGTVVSVATPYAFNLLAAALKAAVPYAAWLLDPKNVLDLFDKGFPLLIQSIEQAAQKLEGGQPSKSAPQSPATPVKLGNLTDPRAVAARNASLSSLPNSNSAPQPPATLNSPAAVQNFVTKTIPQTFASLGGLAPNALRHAAAELTKKQPAARQTLESIVKQLMPYYFGLLALFQIISTSDYDKTIMQQVVNARTTGAALSAAAATGTGAEMAKAVGAVAAKKASGTATAALAGTNENKEMLLRKVISEELHKKARRSSRR